MLGQQECAHPLRGALLRNEDEPDLRMLRLRAYQGGQFADARRTPRRPHVHDHRLAAKVGKRHAAAGQRLQAQVRQYRTMHSRLR